MDDLTLTSLEMKVFISKVRRETTAIAALEDVDENEIKGWCEEAEDLINTLYVESVDLESRFNSMQLQDTPEPKAFKNNIGKQL